MTREELVADSFCVLQMREHTHFQVRSILWNEHTPSQIWQRLTRRRGQWEISDFADEIEEALADVQFFATCGECQELQPQGWMHRVDLCQDCATRNHGVVY